MESYNGKIVLWDFILYIKKIFLSSFQRELSLKKAAEVFNVILDYVVKFVSIWVG